MRSLTQSTPTSIEPERGILSFYRNYDAQVAPSSGAAIMQNVIDVSFGVRTNVMDYITSGGYNRKVYEFNILTMNIDSYDYDYSESYNDASMHPMQDKAFIDLHMSKPKESFVFRDYSASDDPHYRDLYTKKPIYFFNQMQNTIDVTVYGRNDLFAGSTVNMNFIKHTNALAGKPELDDERSGLYFVESVASAFDGNIFTQTLTLTRGGITR